MLPTTRTVRIVTRHSKDCPSYDKGPRWETCNCPKSLMIYEGEGSGKNRRVSAKTRSWVKAEELAQEYRDNWNPDKRELKELKAAKAKQKIRVEDAVAQYLGDMKTRLGDNGTLSMARSLFGTVDPVTKAVIAPGHLFNFLDAQPTRIQFLDEITPAFLTAWRNSWGFKSDLTAANRWTMARGFFRFCENQGWGDSPARRLKGLKAKSGSRTGIFTDAQYTAILDAVARFDPENVPAATRKAWQVRLRTFTELLRWGGLSLTDAVQFHLEKVDAAGVLRYRRQKTGELAVVPLPARVVALLRNVPLERDTISKEQPFRTRRPLSSDTARWSRRLERLFELAGIKEVETDHRMRSPHPHMLRDTFAVWHLRHGSNVRTVAKMLGHSKTTTTERAYLPWVKELEDAHISDARRTLAQAVEPK